MQVLTLVAWVVLRAAAQVGGVVVDGVRQQVRVSEPDGAANLSAEQTLGRGHGCRGCLYCMSGRRRSSEAALDPGSGHFSLRERLLGSESPPTIYPGHA